MKAKDRIIVALDVDSPEKAIGLVEELVPHVGCFKIGLQFITAMLRSLIVTTNYQEARKVLSKIRELFKLLDGNILWDGKFDDIPNTVGGASAEVAKMGVKMFNLHASAGREAITQAVASKGDALVFGVTVLTSIDEEECVLIFGDKPNNKVLQFADMLLESGADGIICAPKEGQLIRTESRFDNMLLACPNIRSIWAQKGIKDDQDPNRQMTPGDAIEAKIDYIVIGRPITKPPEGYGPPAEAAQRIAEEIDKALQLPRQGEET